MKRLALFLIFQIVVLSNTAFGQSINDIAGTYNLEVRKSTDGSILERKLVLNADGTFAFHDYMKHNSLVQPEKHSYAKGTWTNEKKIVSFSTTTSDFDDKHTLDFNNTKARFDTKSPRDKSNRDIKTTLRFYETELFWIQGMTLIKE